MDNKDIKSHIPNTNIKTTNENIKTVTQNIKKTEDKINDNTNSNNSSLEKKTSETQSKITSTMGTVSGLVVAKFNKPLEKHYDKKLQSQKSDLKESKDEIKSERININTQNKREYKNTVKDIKTDSFLDKSDKKKAIENAKTKYASKKYANNEHIKKMKVVQKEKSKQITLTKIKQLSNKFVVLFMAIVVMIVVVATIMNFLISPLGIVFTSESQDENIKSIKTVISEVNTEFANRLQEIQNNNNFDEVSISNAGCQYTIANWQDILAIWDINNFDSSIISVIDENQLNNIRTTCWDMITIDSYIENKENKTVDENGAEVTTTVSVLNIDVHYKNIDEMKQLYNFSEAQSQELNNLITSPEFMMFLRELSANDDVPPIVGNGQFIYPTISKHISAGYPNYSDGSYHGGVDFPVAEGSPVFAVADGTVSTVRKLNKSYGYYIIIDHGNGLSTLYAHNSELLVQEGQIVTQGTIIAYSGTTGNSTGPHCHFEVRTNGNRVNPLEFLE